MSYITLISPTVNLFNTPKPILIIDIIIINSLQTMPNNFDFSEYPYSKIILELQFPQAFEHWDSAGKFWRIIATKWPDLKHIGVTPNSTKSIFGKFYSLEVGIQSANIVCNKIQNDNKEFQDVVNYFFSQVIKIFNINEITRLGYRTIRTLKHNNIKEASEKILSYNLIKQPIINIFGIENGEFNSPQYGISRENDYLGVRINIRVETAKMQIEIPVELAEYFQPSNKEIFMSVIDVDYFTKKKLLVSQLELQTWLNEADRVIKKDLPKIFE